MYEKENIIKEVIASFNFKGNSYSVEEIENALQTAVGRDTNIILEHHADSVVSEDMTEVKRVVSVKCVQVVFSDLNGLPKTIKLYV